MTRTRKRYLRELAAAWSMDRGETYDSLLAAQQALSPIIDEIREASMNLTPGSISEGAMINIQVSVKDCRAILATTSHQ